MAPGGDNWRTPSWLLELLFPDGVYFDPIPINPDGLRERDGNGPWPIDRPIFLNPPYSNPRPWLARAAVHGGPVTCLVKDDPSTSWWDYAEIGHFQVTHIGQRLRFAGARGVASFPSALWRRFR